MIQNFNVFKDTSNNCYQVRTKTQSYTIEFDDIEKENIFLDIVKIVNKKSDISLEELKSKIGKKKDEAKVLSVLEYLDKHSLVPKVFSRDVSESKTSYEDDKSEYKKLSILGQGKLAEIIKKIADKESFESVNLFMSNDDTDIDSEIEKADFIIVVADEWSPFHINKINEFSLKHNKPWLYVDGLEGINAKVGPLFYGQETGCYNCLTARIKSNHDYPEYLQSYENYLTDNKFFSKPDNLPNLNLMNNIIGNMAILEVRKFIEQWSLTATWRKIVKLDVINYDITKHVLLKKPFCEVCKPKLKYNPAPWLEAVTLK